MLRTRLWMGAILIALVVGVLVFDGAFVPWFPFLFVLVLALTVLGCHELLHLLAPAVRPPEWLCQLAAAALVAANWPAHVLPELGLTPWGCLGSVLAAVVLAAFLAEMAIFREPGGSVLRVALTVWTVTYLGFLPAFLVQLRWLGVSAGNAKLGALAVALAVFIPKVCDIGAYFTGRFLGRHRMAPMLSPKKTWEGAAGGLTASVFAAIGLNALGPMFGSPALAAGFGLTVGLAGMLGDLAESLIKRDCGHKDASHVVPGFGGVLDVVDAILFAAPVSYWWILVLSNDQQP